MTYGERLQSLNVFFIKGRLLSADLMKYWKIICKMVSCDFVQLFMMAPSEKTRGHNYKLLMPLCSTDMRYKFFNVRCVAI